MYLGVDIGSSFVKSAILDSVRGEVGEVIKVETPGFVPGSNPLYREISPDEALAVVRCSIDDHLSRRGDIEGILFSTQMHGFVLMDAGGAAVTNYVTWQDERATETIPAFGQTSLQRVGDLLDLDDVRRSGMPVKPSLAICTLYHWQHNERVQARSKPPYWFCTLGDYVIARLAGQKPRSHVTNAAATGLVDMETGEWSATVARKLGFDFLAFPPLIRDDEACGFYRSGTRTIPLYPALADHQSSMYGAYLEPETDLAINMGTGSQICVVSEELTYGEYETRPFFEGKYLRAIPHIPAGRSLNLLTEFVQDIAARICDFKMSKASVWRKLQPAIEAAALAAQPAGAVGQEPLDVNISFFHTSAVPRNGAIHGITEENFNVGNLFYGAFRDMARNYYRLHHRLYQRLYQREPTAESEVRRIVCTGGLAERHPVLRRLIEEQFGLPCSQVPYSGDALAGLLRMARNLPGREIDPRRD